MIPTTERLAAALEAAGDPRLRRMITLARQGEYDDYKSPHPDPINQLVAELMKLGHVRLATRAINGEFDGTSEEAAEWARSTEGRATFRSLFGTGGHVVPEPRSGD